MLSGDIDGVPVEIEILDLGSPGDGGGGFGGDQPGRSLSPSEGGLDVQEGLDGRPMFEQVVDRPSGELRTKRGIINGSDRHDARLLAGCAHYGRPDRRRGRSRVAP